MDIDSATRDMPAADAARFRRVHAGAVAVFGDRLTHVSTPGGSYRASYRVHLDGATAIATCRRDHRRTHLEAMALHRLGPHCNVVPRCLGLADDVLFQSDVGGRRLNVALFESEGRSAETLAHAAVSALFALHRAARRADLAAVMPPLGCGDAWLTRVANAPRRFEKHGARLGRGFDRHALRAALDVAPRQFVKWDCRTGNAALDDDGTLRWFDFEYCGLRHGAEDFAWLIADETQPVAPETMLDIVRDAFDPDCGHDRDAWLDYLSIFTVAHAMQRLLLLQS